MKTSIIILAYNKLDYTQQCIESIRKYTDPESYELILVDNHSTDGTVDWLNQQTDIKCILNEENRGFPAGCNQGIELASGENILLLNNDIIVTHNWLNNLVECLYSADDIGAVGPLTNFASYNQEIKVDYQSTEAMFQFAEEFNVSDPAKWDDRLKLIGFCLLIKKKLVDEIGVLDEIFTPGHYEDDDYSLRIRRAGYRLILCKDTFIHHYGSISFKDDKPAHIELGKTNAGKFEEKWGFHPDYSTYIRNDIVDCIDMPVDSEVRVLEIGCGCGATLLEIRNRYRNATLHGLELNDKASIDAALYAEVSATDIEKSKLGYPAGYFDYIICADVLEHLNDPWQLLRNLKEYLTPTGQILASIPNVMHYTVIRDLINGLWTYCDAGIMDRTHLRFFTAHEIKKMFLETGYPYVAYKALPHLEKHEDLEFIKQLAAISNESMVPQYHANQYIVRAGTVEFGPAKANNRK